MKMCVFTLPPVSAAPPRVPEGCISLIAGLLLPVGSFERSVTSILRVIPSPAHQVQSPHFTTCVRGLCHGITPLFLPADVPGTPRALRHVACCLAKRVARRGSEAIQASAATGHAFTRP